MYGDGEAGRKDRERVKRKSMLQSFQQSAHLTNITHSQELKQLQQWSIAEER